MTSYEVFDDARFPVKAWVKGVPFDDNAKEQMRNVANLPFIHKWLAVMPDAHLGFGATVGSVIATRKAIIPSAVGVDLGCGMRAIKTSLTSHDLPESLGAVRDAIEKAVPHGRSDNGGPNDKGRREKQSPNWAELEPGFKAICEKHPAIESSNSVTHLGTLGGGNHFIELCLDEDDRVWVMLHSGSRGVGNRIGSHFIRKAKKEMERFFIHLPDKDLAYLPEGSKYFEDYVEAVSWAQRFAKINREIMMRDTLQAVASTLEKSFSVDASITDCHHNYISWERHYGKHVYVTRKGAVSAKRGEMGIIPGSMGAKSFIVRGLGNLESFHSCSHGAGRVMSRTEAKKLVSVEQHAEALKDVECRKDKNTIDETPAAYKNIDDVMAAQDSLVEIVHTLKQVVCVKG